LVGGLGGEQVDGVGVPRRNLWEQKKPAPERPEQVLNLVDASKNGLLEVSPAEDELVDIVNKSAHRL
jgi:hypothetical protein